MQAAPFFFPFAQRSKHTLTHVFPLPSPSSEMFLCSHPNNKHPSWAGFRFASPYQTAPESGCSSTPSSLLFHPGTFGSGSCLRSAKQLTLESRWSERFVKPRQIEIKQQITKKSLIHLPMWSLPRLLEGGSTVGQRLVHP